MGFESVTALMLAFASTLKLRLSSLHTGRTLYLNVWPNNATGALHAHLKHQ